MTSLSERPIKGLLRILVNEDEKKADAFPRRGLAETRFVVDVASGEDGLTHARVGNSRLALWLNRNVRRMGYDLRDAR